MRKCAYTATAALIAAAFISLLGLLSPQVQARSPEGTVLEEVAVKKGDRLDVQPLGTDCSAREWPYFEAGCLRNASDRTTPARLPRIVTVDRLPSPQDAGAMVASR
jgi:hypothetical protein